MTGGTALAIALLASVIPASAVPVAAASAGRYPGRKVCGPQKRGHVRCHLQDAAPDGGTGVGGFYSPADLQSAYKLPSATAGSGMTIGVIDAFDDPNAESDLGVYRSNYGLPACTTANGCFRKVNQTGGSTPPAADTGWGQEISADLDMVSATCPNCKIILVEADSTSADDVGAANNEAISLGANVTSNSYGGTEDPSETSLDTYYNHPGIPETVSSGDNGYGVQYPAASPYVTAVGGTALVTASNARGWSETAWSGAGSGCSTVESKPSWQSDAGCSRRTVADVSAVASTQTGVSAYDSFGSPGWMGFAGTSVSAPIVAGMYGLQSSAFRAAGAKSFYQWAYSLALGTVFDVTSGTNGSCGGTYLCTASSGYDGPTGLGSPDGAIEPVVALAGAAGTDPVMRQVVRDLSGRSVTINGASEIALAFEIPTAPGSAFAVPGDQSCRATTWSADPASPNGTSSPTRGTAPYGQDAARSYLISEDSGTGPGSPSGTDGGCVDVARTFAGPQSGDPATFNYFAYGLDAVSWATPSLKAPATLTTAQLRGIYQCTITDWAQVGGTTGQIQRYLPNGLSATRRSFLSEVLSLSVGSGPGTFSEAASGTPGSHDAQGRSTYCPAVKGDGTNGQITVDEDEATQIAIADHDKAILPYSAGQWVRQSEGEGNPTLDLRNGARFGGIITTPTNGPAVNNSAVMFGTVDDIYELNTQAAETANGDPTAGVVDEQSVRDENGNIGEAGGSFPGVRFLYDLLDGAGHLSGYQAALDLLGFDNEASPTVVSPLCSGAQNFERAAIASAGYAPLNTTGGGSHNQAHSSCRLLP